MESGHPDLLRAKTHNLIHTFPHLSRRLVLKSYQDRFRYIMVDEYQDTNTAQFELIRLLAAGAVSNCRKPMRAPSP